MNPFVHFLRFFTLSDDNRTTPGNAQTVTAAHPTLPALPGDVLRWLLPKSDLGGLPASRCEIVLIRAEPATPSLVVGSVRPQDSERYVELELSADGLPGQDQQFALMHSVANPRFGATGEPERIDVPVLGTVRGQFADLNAYLTAIQTQYEQYAHAPVVVTRQNNRLTVRIYFSQRFAPSDFDLTTWRVGLGKTPADRYNTNSPSLSAQSLGVVSITATDSYTVIAGEDIQEGNVFRLQGRTYTASASDSPERILSALSVPESGRLLVAAGSAIALGAEPGKRQLRNQNRPTLELLYDSPNGSGSDRYTVVVGLDLLPGNAYQVSAPGMTTRTVVAVEGDTPTTIAAQFTTSGGFLLIPSGQNPAPLTDAGTLLIDNTNVPMLYLSGKVSQPAYSVNRYRVFVGTSVRRGNVFVLGSQAATAVTGDTPGSIARKLGYSVHPFTVDVPVGNTLTAYAKRGSRFAEPDDRSPVSLTRIPVCVRPIQVVAEVRFPMNVSPGRCWLGLRERGTTALLARSNNLLIQRIANGTALLRWGGTRESRRIFGFHYAETGLTQQLRLPLHVGTARQKTTESQTTTMRGDVLRTDVRIKLERRLHTTMQPEAFHRALLLALKHPRLMIDGRPYESLGEYSESEPTPVGKLFQASTDLTETPSEQQYLTYGEAEAVALARVLQVLGAESLLLYMKQNGVYTPLSEGRFFAAGEYDLHVQTPAEPMRLAVYNNDLLMLSKLLTPDSLNRVGRLRIGPGDQLSIRAMPDRATVHGWLNSTLDTAVPDILTDGTESENRPGDFGTDFSPDFIH